MNLRVVIYKYVFCKEWGCLSMGASVRDIVRVQSVEMGLS